MKYLKTYERRNTRDWYGKSMSDYNVDKIIDLYFKLISNPNIENIKVFDLTTLKTPMCIFYIYTGVKDIELKGWNVQSEISIDKFRKLGKEYSDEEIEDWIKYLELKEDSNKYNI